MSVHPNVMLMAVLTPGDLSRRTMAAILECEGTNGDGEVVIEGNGYHPVIMEDTYQESWQVSAAEGDLVFLDLVTYGYGEFITWDELEKRKKALEAWADRVSLKHNCSYEIRVSANYR